VEAQTSGPSATTAIYDGALGAVVLFGASAWRWNGVTWIADGPGQPPTRPVQFAAAYDGLRKNIVLFGGLPTGGSGSTNDTWTWDGATWTQQHPRHVPPALSHGLAYAAYDAARGVVVLVLGPEASSTQTWTWNGTDWTQQHPASSPAGRYFASIAYDDALGRVLLFGGKTGTLSGGLLTEQVTNELWSWDGTNWARLSP
jgi:hypothetical protein